MTGAPADWQGHTLHVTRSGYTGEDGFEISAPLPNDHALALARAVLAQPTVQGRGPGRSQRVAPRGRPVLVRQRH